MDTDDNNAQVGFDQQSQHVGNQTNVGGNLYNQTYNYFQASPPNLRRSFDALIADKLQNFVGRQFVFDAVDEFLKDKNNLSGYFIIRGEPGIGKSALVAKLIKDRGYIHHFNIATQNIRSSRAFLENVCKQLIARYDLKEKEPSPTAYDDGGFLMQCLGEAAADPKNHPVVVAIDSLDEADRSGLSPAVNSLYLPASLPQGVYIIVTTRLLQDMHLQVMRMKSMDIVADSQGNLRDIEAYIVNFVQHPEMKSRLKTWKIKEPELFITALKQKSQGNFMYLYHVLPAIESGSFVNGTLVELPEGLLAFYQRHWRQMREGRENEFETVYKPIICILGTAKEPSTIDQIASWTQVPFEQVKKYIGLWREFLTEEQIDGERYYRIYHASFQDFLREEVGLKEYNTKIVGHIRSLIRPKN